MLTTLERESIAFNKHNGNKATHGARNFVLRMKEESRYLKKKVQKGYQFRSNL